MKKLFLICRFEKLYLIYIWWNILLHNFNKIIIRVFPCSVRASPLSRARGPFLSFSSSLRSGANSCAIEGSRERCRSLKTPPRTLRALPPQWPLTRCSLTRQTPTPSQMEPWILRLQSFYSLKPSINHKSNSLKEAPHRGAELSSKL